MNYYAGIDPGKDGSIVILEETGKVTEILMIPKIPRTEIVDKRNFMLLFQNLMNKYGERIRYMKAFYQ